MAGARSLPANNQFFRLWKAFHNRRNWMFSDTVAGVQASANLYSLSVSTIRFVPRASGFGMSFKAA